ncbi:MAG: metallophosphoesterase [Verrucomicrobiota bacterium]
MNFASPSAHHTPIRIPACWILLFSLLQGVPRIAADQTLVPSGAIWKYLDTGASLGTTWRNLTFDDSGWKWGPAQLGYGDGDEATLVSYGPNASAKFITTYFRKTFSVADASLFSNLALRVLRDDGVIIHLNGTEIYRNNMPAGTVTGATLASTGISGLEESTAFLSATLGTGTLVSGNNVLAVEIHQSSGTSSDISFDLELVGITPARPSITRGPYLQKATSDSMTVRWRTSQPTDTRLTYGTNTPPGQVLTVPDSTTEHAVTLTGLIPNALYYYAVGDSAGILASGSDYLFYTAPPTGTIQPMRFWVLGDAGTGSSGQLAVRNAFYQQTGGRYTDLILLLGDNAYNTGTDAEYQSKVFDVYGSIFRSTASFSVVGNHDTAQLANPDLATTPYFQIFNPPMAGEGGGVASGSPKYYSFNYGNVHFVCLDSMTSDRTPSGPMLTWLQQDLEQNSADWLIALFHHPPYSKGSHDSDNPLADGGRMTEMRANALPILEANGVDLVLSGHSHSYERSFLLDQHYGISTTLTSSMILDSGSGRESETGAYSKAGGGPVPNQGAVYVVTGSAGQIAGGTLNHPAMFISLDELGSFIVDVHGPRLDARFLTSAGTTNDSFTLVKDPPANLPPSVLLNSPTEGASVTEGSPLTLSAATLDSDGTVTSVAFQVDGIPLTTDLDVPFSTLWTATGVGQHLLSAVATDNSGGQTVSASVSITVIPRPPPAAPTDLQIAAVLANRVDLGWIDRSSDETQFQVERSLDGADFAEIGTAPQDGTAFADTTVLPANLYFYRVRALGPGGYSTYSPTASTTTPPVPPLAPSNLTALPSGSTAVNLRWMDNATNETGFRVERSPNGVDWTGVASPGTDSTSYTDSAGLKPGSTYWYKVRAFNSAGDSSDATPVSVTLPVTLPAAPSSLTARAYASNSIYLTWIDTANNESGFLVERSTNAVDWVQIRTLSADTTNYFNSAGVTAGIMYSYRIRSYNTAGNSAYSGVASATIPTSLPAAPINLIASSPRTATVNLNWTDMASNEDGFKVERSFNGVDWTQINTTGVNVTFYSNSAGVVSGTQIRYRVRAYNALGNSPYSNTVNITPP